MCAFRESLEAQKCEILACSAAAKEEARRRLEAARLRWALVHDADLARAQAEEKRCIILEIEAIRAGAREEREALARERAEWARQHELWKQDALARRQEERAAHQRARDEEVHVAICFAEASSAENERAISELTNAVGELRQRLLAIQAGDIALEVQAWLRQQREALAARRAELAAEIREKNHRYLQAKAAADAEVEAESRALSARRAQYEADLKQWQGWACLLDQGPRQGVLALNVGGKAIDASLALLCAARGSRLDMFFRHMDRHALLRKDARGRIFIDRDPRYFNHLLNYLAGGGHAEAFKDPFDNSFFDTELEYWGITPGLL